MRDEDIHIGDTLRIRSYEDMKSEFGADSDGDIPGDIANPRCSVYFLTSMSNLCGVFNHGCLSRARAMMLNGKLPLMMKLHFCFHEGGYSYGKNS